MWLAGCDGEGVGGGGGAYSGEYSREVEVDVLAPTGNACDSLGERATGVLVLDVELAADDAGGEPAVDRDRPDPRDSGGDPRERGRGRSSGYVTPTGTLSVVTLTSRLPCRFGTPGREKKSTRTGSRFSSLGLARGGATYTPLGTITSRLWLNLSLARAAVDSGVMVKR